MMLSNRFNLYALLILAVLVIFSQASDCQDNADCNNNGECVDGTCICANLFEGTHCETDFRDNSSFVIVIIIHSALTIVVDVFLICYSLHCMVKGCSGTTSCGKFFTIPHQTLMLVMVGAIVQILYFLIDPHNLREINPTWLDFLWWSAPFVIWISAGFRLVSFYLHVLDAQNIASKFRGFAIFKTIAMAMVFITYALFVILSIAVALSPLGYLLYSFVTTLIYLFFIALFSYTAYKFCAVLNNSLNLVSSSGTRVALSRFMFKLKWGTLVSASSFLLALILVGFASLVPNQTPFLYAFRQYCSLIFANTITMFGFEYIISRNSSRIERGSQDTRSTKRTNLTDVATDTARSDEVQKV